MEHSSSWDIGARAFEGIDISGISIRPLLDRLQGANARTSLLLRQEGLGVPGEDGRVRIEPLAWYPLGRCVQIIQEVSAGLGDTMLFQIGLDVAQAAPEPVWVRDVQEVLRSLDATYHAGHRLHGRSMLDPAAGELLGGIGHYTYERVDERRFLAVASSPYPCAFERGLLMGRCRRFQPNAWVFHDDARPCRRRGAASCTYQITWL